MGLFQRTKFVVNPKAQYKIVLFLGGIAVISALVIMVVTYSQLMKVSPLIDSSLGGPDEIIGDIIIRISIVVFVMIIYFIIAGVVLTNRVAGPIWRLEDQLRRYLSGEKIDPIKFRKEDEFQELPDIINEVLSRCKK